MKLRIKGNTLRLRLLRSEVDALASTGRVSENIEFGNGNGLQYSLAVSDADDHVRARFADDHIEVSLPGDTAREWAGTEMVAIEAEQPTGVDGGVLAILIEKDFACLDRRDDPDREDAFPNPHSQCGPDKGE